MRCTYNYKQSFSLSNTYRWTFFPNIQHSILFQLKSVISCAIHSDYNSFSQKSLLYLKTLTKWNPDIFTLITLYNLIWIANAFIYFNFKQADFFYADFCSNYLFFSVAIFKLKIISSRNTNSAFKNKLNSLLSAVLKFINLFFSEVSLRDTGANSVEASALGWLYLRDLFSKLYCR